MDPAIIIAVVAGAAVGAAAWARDSAKAAKRSADAAERSASAGERSASADERSADTASAALALGQENAAMVQHERVGQNAPELVVVNHGSAACVLSNRGLTCHFENLGPGAVIVDGARVRAGGDEFAWPGETDELEAHRRVVLVFDDPGVVAIRDGAGTPVVTIDYRAVGTTYRARTRWRLLRNGADAGGAPIWKADREGIERLDRPA